MASLSPNVFIARIDERAVVLDLGQDAYRALSPKLSKALDLVLGEVEGGSAAPIDLGEARRVLAAKGIVLDAGGPARRWRPAPLPVSATATLWPSPEPNAQGRGPKLTDGLQVMRALAQAWGALRVLRFQDAVGWTADRLERPRIERANWSAQRVVDLFFNVRPWFPVKPICRLDAIALALLLHHYGCPARLVFGVKLEPFKAHCWVQHGAQVLNEPHDYVLELTPILAL